MKLKFFWISFFLVLCCLLFVLRVKLINFCFGVFILFNVVVILWVGLRCSNNLFFLCFIFLLVIVFGVKFVIVVYSILVLIKGYCVMVVLYMFWVDFILMWVICEWYVFCCIGFVISIILVLWWVYFLVKVNFILLEE